MAAACAPPVTTSARASSSSSSRRARSSTPACPPKYGGASRRPRRRGRTTATTSRRNTRRGACGDAARPNTGRAAARAIYSRLLNRELAARDRRLLDERECQKAVLVLRLAPAFVELDGQRERTVHVAVVALVAKHARVLVDAAALHLGGDRHLVAFDGDVDLVLRDACQFGLDDVAVLGFGDVDRQAARRGALRALGTKETAKQGFDRRVRERVVDLQAGHDLPQKVDVVAARAPLRPPGAALPRRN